jgi:hypothetical protein
MSKQTTKAFLFMELGYDIESGDYEEKWRPTLWKCRVDDSDRRVFIREMSVEADIPDDFDPVARQIAALERQKREALEEYQRTVAILNERISKLQAITYTPEVVA